MAKRRFEVGRRWGWLVVVGLVGLGPVAYAVPEDSAIPGEWKVRIAEEIAAREYRFSPSPDGTWTAPNRAHGLRSTVSRDGLDLQPRVPASSRWRLGLSLSGVGRGEAIAPLGPARFEPTPSRIDLVFDGVTEWFVNAPKGVEHGFEIFAAPAGDRSEPLRLDLATDGSVRPLAVEDPADVVFIDAAGRPVARYGGLVAWDAAGQPLEAHFEITASTLSIRVDDRDARYPVVVDPVAGAAWSADGGQVGAEFGLWVAPAGDVNNDGYDDVIVGCDEYDAGQVSEGQAFVYYGSPSGLPLMPSWTAQSDQAGADFANPVGPAGDVNGDGFDDVIIGSYKFDNGEINEGAVFVYYGSLSGLDANGTRPIGTPLNADWRAESDQADSGFGVAAVSAGDVNGDTFGDVIVGSDGYSGEYSFEGAAWIFLGSPNGLNPDGSRPIGKPFNADWERTGGKVDVDFGYAAASAGDLNNDGFDDIVVGAWNWDETKLDEGKAFVFLGSALGPSTTPVWTFLGGQNTAYFGISVGSAGDVNNDGFDDLLVGADAYEIASIDSGAAFVFLGGPGGPATSPSWTAGSGQGSSDFGFFTRAAGDVNGDGFDDVIVGASAWDNGEIDEGAAFLYMGSTDGLGLQPAFTVESNQIGASFGVSASGAGDVNGDGFDDLIVGADTYSTALDICSNRLCSLGGNPCASDLECAGGTDVCLGSCSFTGTVCGDDTNCDGGQEGAAFLYFGCADQDRDGICDVSDNCPLIPNADQADADLDGDGDRCDSCTDADDDGYCDADLELVGWAGPGERVLVEFGSPMRYLGNTLDPAIGMGWTLEFFDDSLWPSGAYGVGYEADQGAESLISATVPIGTVSVFSRAEFEITDVTMINNIFLGADYDDGYVAYINGHEVFRSSEMPAGPLAWNTVPFPSESSNQTVPNYGSLHDISIEGLPVLHNGINVLAVGIWNTGATSSDLVLVPRLSVNRAATKSMTYRAHSSDPGGGTSWTTLAYNDAGWTRGNYGVGYDTTAAADSLINTIVPTNTYSIYTRATFSVALEAVERLLLGADFDDGFAAFINGFEVYRSPQLPGGPLVWNSIASAHESSNGAVPDYGAEIDITATALPVMFSGENVLAVGVWNNAAPNDDDLVIVPRLAVRGANLDNCPGVYNPTQADLDLDGLGDACDPDRDGDGFLNGSDNCPDASNPTQSNQDGDAFGDACDECVFDPLNDQDNDGLCSNEDNCPTVYNPDQTNSDPDGLGDACDPDDDNDGDLDGADNCPLTYNPNQENADGDVRGDACDCDPGSNAVWSTPSAISTLRVARYDACVNLFCTVGGNPCTSNAECVAPPADTLRWQPPSDLGATSARYDTLRATGATAFGSAVCVESNQADLRTSDGTVPGSGGRFFYLIRAENACPGSTGNLGTTSAGTPRTGVACP